MENDLISVIVPVYNAENYLKECIDSILYQSYSNLEILLINDESTDNSGKICEEYSKKDKRIKVFHKKNGGAADCRNFGIKKSSGNYITFIDSDDYVKNNYVKDMLDLIKKDKTLLAISSICFLYNDNNIRYQNKNKETCLLSTEECLDRLLCENGISVSACAKLYDKRLFKKISYPKGKKFEDDATTYKIILKCDYISYTSECNYVYKINDNSIMTSNFSEDKFYLIECTDIMCNNIVEKYPSLYYSSEKRKLHAKISIIRQIEESVVNKNIRKKEKEIIKDIRKNIKKIFNNPKINISEKVAVISLLFGRRFFYFFWRLYKIIR